jgi:hypothetical protein
MQIKQLKSINEGALPIYYYNIDKLEDVLNDLDILHDGDVRVLQFAKRDKRYEKALCVIVKGVEAALK